MAIVPVVTFRFAPRTCFCQVRLDTLRSIRYPEAIEASYSIRSFTIPQRSKLYSPNRDGIDVPDLYLRRSPRLVQRPVRLRTPLLALSALRRGGSTSATRCRLPIRGSESDLSASTPLRGVSTPRDQSAKPRFSSGGLPDSATRFPFAPRQGPNFIQRH